VSCAPDRVLLLVDLGEPGQELVCLTLRNFGVGKEAVPGLGLPGHRERGLGEDGHGGGGGGA